MSIYPNMDLFLNITPNNLAISITEKTSGKSLFFFKNGNDYKALFKSPSRLLSTVISAFEESCNDSDRDYSEENLLKKVRETPPVCSLKEWLS